MFDMFDIAVMFGMFDIAVMFDMFDITVMFDMFDISVIGRLLNGCLSPLWSIRDKNESTLEKF